MGKDEMKESMEDKRGMRREMDVEVSAGVRSVRTCGEFHKSGLGSYPHVWKKRLLHSLGNVDINLQN